MGRGRPPLPRGAHGKITTDHLGPSRYAARTRYRDRDGVVRPVERYGQSKSEAERRLKEHLADRTRAVEESGISGHMTIGALADKWLASDDVQHLAVNSREAYRLTIKNQVKPQLRGVRVSELDPATVNEAIKRVRATSGPSAAKSMKTVLSGMCALAVSYRALPTNPMRDAAKVRGSGKRPTRRVLTREEEAELTDKLRSTPAALPPSTDNPGGRDLADLIDWLDGTGCRIGEALAAREGINQDGEPLLDLEAGTWEINATLIRVGGVRRRKALEAKEGAETITWEEFEELRALRTLAPGLHVQERTKSDAGWRRIALPWYCVEIARRRREQLLFRPDVPVLFPSPRAQTLRDPRNTAREWRELRGQLGYDWLNFHKFRSTVLTRLLEAGIDPAKVADHGGHSRPSMTLDFYAGRNVVVSNAARVLDR